MRRKVICTGTVLLCLLLILAGCDAGSSDSARSSSRHSNLAQVYLTIGGEVAEIAQKSMAVDSDLPGLEDFTYQYNAVPQWTEAVSYVDGDTRTRDNPEGWTDIEDGYSAGMSLGYFEQGMWLFGIRVYNGSTLVLQGYELNSVSVGSPAVKVTVGKVAGNDTGTVIVRITAPTVDGESLAVSYTGQSSSAEPVIADVTDQQGGITTFSANFSIPAGDYKFKFENTAAGSTAVKAIEVRATETATITGFLDNGSYNDLSVAYISDSVAEKIARLFNNNLNLSPSDPMGMGDMEMGDKYMSIYSDNCYGYMYAYDSATFYVRFNDEYDEMYGGVSMRDCFNIVSYTWYVDNRRLGESQDSFYFRPDDYYDYLDYPYYSYRKWFLNNHSHTVSCIVFCTSPYVKGTFMLQASYDFFLSDM